MARRARGIIEVLLLATLLAGCASVHRLDPDSIDRPGFGEIYRTYEQAVTSCMDSRDESWHTGWIGNGLVYVLDDSHKGLCYQWQDVVLVAVLPVAQAAGWHAVEIGRKVDEVGEHHAVLVFELANDGDSIERDAPAYVLDPWARGRADVFTKAAWIGNRE